ncbi:deoxyribodipyrimidine photo-lyase [Candidatus Bathyarchaeota archaeon]|nr:deoxyribodipyrimidine photo-lyase [Candidatus Bathyarchaeota archaeon]
MKSVYKPKEIRNQISEERVRRLNFRAITDRSYVLYWMQSSQRLEYNFALEYAILKANKLNKPLMVFFGIAPLFLEGNLRHYSFMLEGLQETRDLLQNIGVKMVVLAESPDKGAIELSKDACLTVVDKGYLRPLRKWYSFVAENVNCPLIQVEDNVVVPVETASGKEEYSARTLRAKIANKIPFFLFELVITEPNRDSLDLEFDSLDLKDIAGIISALRIDDSVCKTERFRGGTSEASKRLEIFLEDKLPEYADLRNDPSVDYQSMLSPYLHFGQISPVHIALKVVGAQASISAKEAYLEELIVRRELAVNYVHYNSNYDRFAGLPEWAKRTLLSHKNDPREYLYSLIEFENAETHDPIWNAAQNEMRLTGKMHGYMRMYWGKKIIEWSESPEDAFNTALYLNNKYELDGRDPNGFAGVAWCFGKHDRPWKERPIFGSVRYMSENGLRRKFDIDNYVTRIGRV